MSLQTDIAFYHALSHNERLSELVGGRIYNTAIPLPDEDVMNVPVPYIIITFDGLTNDNESKDDPYEGDSDSVQIGVIVTAKWRETLGEIMQIVRDTIHDYFVEHADEEDIIPVDYALTASGVDYDSLKQCFWQTLNYQCDTNR